MDIPIIALTGNVMEGDKEKCLAAGMQDYLTKPIRKNQMLKLIARWLPDHILGDVGKECYNKVLLVEDNSINRAMAKEMLKGLGFVVTSAINGKIGVEKAQENEFDLILMDCQMPEMDGFEATKAIRELQEQEKIKPTPIIALTANAMKGDRELCIKAGMDDYITKPVKKDTLQTSIAKWITPSTIVSNTDASKIDVIDYNIFNTYKEVVAEKFTSSVHLSLENTRKLIDKLQASYKANDLQSIITVAYSLKSASAALGLNKLSDAARLLENEAHQQITIDGKTSNISEHSIGQLEQSYENTSKELRTLLNNKEKAA